MRRLIYIQDDQGYWGTPIVFDTDCNYTVKQFEELSYKAPGAGRFSTSFLWFQKRLKELGFKCNLVNEYSRPRKKGVYVEIPEEIKHLECVQGATGNY